MGVARRPWSSSDMHLEIVAPMFICLVGSPTTLQAAPQFRGLLRSFYNFNGFPVADPNKTEQNKKFPTIFSNGLREVSKVTHPNHPVRIPSGKSPAKTTTARARPQKATTRIRIIKTTAAPVTTARIYTTTTSTSAAPTTTVTTTIAPTTRAPTTAAPTTKSTTTEAPKTRAPTTTTTTTTEPPTTKPPTTRASSTEAPTTKAPTTTSLPSTTAAIINTAAGEGVIEIVPAEIEIEEDEMVDQLLEQTSEDNSVQSVIMSEKLLEMALTRLKEMEGEISK